jgi:hypothetical protein
LSNISILATYNMKKEIRLLQSLAAGCGNTFFQMRAPQSSAACEYGRENDTFAAYSLTRSDICIFSLYSLKFPRRHSGFTSAFTSCCRWSKINAIAGCKWGHWAPQKAITSVTQDLKTDQVGLVFMVFDEIGVVQFWKLIGFNKNKKCYCSNPVFDHFFYLSIGFYWFWKLLLFRFLNPWSSHGLRAKLHISYILRTKNRCVICWLRTCAVVVPAWAQCSSPLSGWIGGRWCSHTHDASGYEYFIH